MDFAEERRIKHERVAEFLDRHRLEGVLLARRCNFSWYTGGARNYVSTGDDAGNSTLLVTHQGAAVLATNIEATRLREEDFVGTDVEVMEYFYADAADRTRVFEAAAGWRRVAADAAVPGVPAAPLPAEFNRLRWALLPSEVRRYRDLCTDVVGAVEAAARSAEPGETEHALAGRLAGLLSRAACVPWVLLVAADERVARHRHPLPTSRRIERTFMLVTCAERGGLIAACSRLACFGRVPPDLEARHRAVCTVDAALQSATRPGATLGTIFAEAQAAYAAVGYADEWRRHHQGGSIGYLPREVRAGPDSPEAALENQAFAWNPSITGTKVEDTTLCAAGGAAVLAAPTGWPTVRAEWTGFSMDRPALLAR